MIFDDEALAIFILSLTSLILAQLIKFFGYGILKNDWDYTRLYNNGGMPSSHSAIVSCLTVSILLFYGLTIEFAICAVLALIVIHDATNVRYESSKHAVMLNRLLKELPEDQQKELGYYKALKERIGHKPSEAYVGICLGIIIAVIGFLLYGLIF